MTVNETGKLPARFDLKRCLLFLGAGATHGCVSTAADAFPQVGKLKSDLASLLNEDPTKYSLRTLASGARRKQFDLVSYLQRNYTTASTNSFIKSSAKLPWMRIYTTNYDDAFESAQRYASQTPSSFSYLDKRPKKLPPSSIIHIHGYVHDLKREIPIEEQVVLDEASYARDDFKSTPWWDQFKRDLEFAHYIFFCGYSLSDISIKEILIKSPSLRQKTYFVLKDDIADLEREELLDYGHVSLEGRDHFIELAKDQFDAQTDDSVSVESQSHVWLNVTTS